MNLQHILQTCCIIVISDVIFHTLELKRNRNLPIGHWNFEIPELWKETSKEEGAIIVLPLMRSQLSSQYQHVHKRSNIFLGNVGIFIKEQFFHARYVFFHQKDTMSYWSIGVFSKIEGKQIISNS